MKEDIYSFGECIFCKQVKALKNGICKDCQEKKKKIFDDFGNFNMFGV